MPNTYSDSIISTTTKPTNTVNIVVKPSSSGEINNEPYVGLYALLTEDSYEILYEDLSSMNTENL